ncbi:DUF3473 domain-containing protein [Balneolaceae bacterium YR4-1]|uniref:DUF3473 domain-containing protein n=1 Tax=Halalkalibaculum roseum TaxID=2709311 RepID=A0A6M1SKV8_9BACT|nr:XrtA system polysaccharide deacetylase [Halalkalibaculum roseum]NGP75951.1 DUF3473 domain-containing protein [Halalkalibaculum roseum]
MHDVYITIDVEDWFQVENLRPSFPLSTWDKQEWRVEANVNLLLEMLDRHACRTTFFVLGQVAERFPHIVKNIVNNGHELASHGYNHVLLYEMDSEAITTDLKRSKAILEDISGKEVFGYRAPSFSVNDENIEIIRSAGYRYDSSYNDFGGHDRYGTLELAQWTKKRAGVYEHPDDNFFEIPIQNLRMFGSVIPWGGGGYFRMIPWPFFKRGIAHIIEQSPYIFYLHPWEIDPGQPRVSGLSFTSRLRHYTNLSKVEGRLGKLMEAFSPSQTMSDLVGCLDKE